MQKYAPENREIFSTSLLFKKNYDLYMKIKYRSFFTVWRQNECDFEDIIGLVTMYFTHVVVFWFSYFYTKEEHVNII